MHIFLTGGRGMVGKNFKAHPSAAEHTISAPGSDSLDLSNYDAVADWISDNRPDFIVHAAGRVGGIQANIREPVAFFLDNLDMGRNLLRAARANNVSNVLNLSSSCTYPRDAVNPLREETILQGELEPTNEGYALAKIAVARLCEYINKEDASFLYKTLVPCNIYGPHDKFDPRHSHMVPAIIHKLHLAMTNDGASVDIWGDGSARREFMYVGDLADCMWRAVERFESMPSVMNVGLGHDLSVNDYYRAAADVVGYRGAFTHDLTKPVGMKQKLVSVDKANDWGWRAGTSLESGLRQTYEFYKKECVQ